MADRRGFIGAIVLLCLLSLLGCQSLKNIGKPAKPKEIELTSTELEKAKLLKQLDRKYENPEVHYKLGELYQAEGRWAEADQHYGVALGFDPVHRRAQAGRVKVLQQLGDTEKAAMLADIYIEQASTSALASLQLALAFQKQQMDDYALRCYEQALRLAPNSARVNKQIGYYYLAKGDRGRAKDYLMRSYQINPNQPEVAGELGRLGVEITRRTGPDQSSKKLEKLQLEEKK